MGSSPLRVLLAGKHELACAIFDLLTVEAEAVDLHVVTAASERAEGRRASLKAALRERGITPVATDAGHVELEEAVKYSRPDVLLSAGFDRIVREATLALVPWPLNVHFGALPRYRGSYSIPWAILNRESEIGVTLHRMAHGIDDGPILAQTSIGNDPDASARTLYDLAVRVGTDLVRDVIGRIAGGEHVHERAQDEEAATYYPPEYPGAFRIPWRQTTRYVRDYIRAGHFPPLPGARTTVAGMRVEVSWPVETVTDGASAAPGTIEMANGVPAVATLNGHVVPHTVAVDGQRIGFQALVQERSLVGARCA